MESYCFVAVPESGRSCHRLWQSPVRVRRVLRRQHQNESYRDLQRRRFCMEKTALPAPRRFLGSSGAEKTRQLDLSSHIRRQAQPLTVQQSSRAQYRPLDSQSLRPDEGRSFLPQGQTHQQPHIPDRRRVREHRGIFSFATDFLVCQRSVILGVLHDEGTQRFQPVPGKYQTQSPETRRYSQILK